MTRAIRSREETKWQRQDDARTLAMAQEIMANKSRHNGAVKEAVIMAKEDEKRMKAMKKVAAKKPVTRRKPVAKKPVRKTIKKKTK